MIRKEPTVTTKSIDKQEKLKKGISSLTEACNNDLNDLYSSMTGIRFEDDQGSRNDLRGGR